MGLSSSVEKIAELELRLSSLTKKLEELERRLEALERKSSSPSSPQQGETPRGGTQLRGYLSRTIATAKREYQKTL